jgi:Ca2+-binding RTX toxin-like protein
LTLLVLALVLAASASAGEGPTARILFETFPSRGGDTPYGLGLAAADGTAFVDVTSSVVRDHHAALEPAWSPNGSAVAFTLYRSHENSSGYSAGEIDVVDAAETSVRQLTGDATDSGTSNETPVWSPDGSRIAWLKWRGKGSDVWVMNADGGAQHAITTDGATGAANTNVAWSPDGERLAWLKRVGSTEVWRPNGNVWLAGADGLGARAVTSSSLVLRGPLWQPGGLLLLYGEGARMTKLHLVDPAIGPPGVLIDSAGYTNASVEPYGDDPAWSPSGDRIAWGDQAGVEVATASGVARRVAAMTAYGVSWSPDESKLAFVHDQGLQEGRYVCGCASVYVVETAGSTPRIVSGREGSPDLGWFSPLWWPDSARLSIGGEWGIVNVNADGTCLRAFPNGSGQSIGGPLSWQPGSAALPSLPQCVALEGTGWFGVDVAPFGAVPHVQFTVTNRGNATGTELTVIGVPSSGTVATTTPGCTGGDTLRCTLGSLAGLASVKIGMDVSYAKPGNFRLAVTMSVAEQQPVRVALPLRLLPCTTAGTDSDNVIVGTAGRDTICGFGGDDLIRGLAGNDWIDGGSGYDIVHGGAGDDVIVDDLGHDRLYGDAGNDVISGGNGPDEIYGGPGNDRLSGGLYPDRLFGGAGDDFINAADGYRDYVDCGPGNDTVVTGSSYLGDRIKNCEHVIKR